MIPQKVGTDVDLNEQIDKDIAKAEEKSKQDIKNSKPRMAQAVAMKYIKYVVICFTVISIGYKMFFAKEKEEPKHKKTKVMKSSKEDEQQKLASGKVGKTKDNDISREKVDTKTVLSVDEQAMSNFEVLNDIQVPKMQIPTVPNVPTIDKITIADKENSSRDNGDGRNIAMDKKEKKDDDKMKTGSTEEDKKIEEKKSRRDVLPESSSDKKESRFTVKSKDKKDARSGSLPNSPLSSKISEEMNKKNGKKGTQSSKNESSSMRALDEMFVLSGQGQSNNDRRNSTESKNDFIVFDGSSVSIQETSMVQSDTNITRASNLENTIATGKVIEGVLEMAINSESAGTIRAVVSKDVLGERGDKILIPRGSRVYGSYAKTTSALQRRLLITWNKVIRPDGITISMQADTYDQTGKKGIEGNIDTRYGEMFKNSLLYSFVMLGSAVALEKIAGIKGTTQYLSNGTVATANVTPSNIAAKSVIETTQDITKKMTDGLLDDLDSIISVPQGTLIKIISNTDIVIPVEYRRYTGGV